MKRKATEKTALQPLPGRLVFIRHTESAWNALGKWTGITDIHLTPKGRREAVKLGEAIRDIAVHHTYTSTLIRTIETLLHMMEAAEHLKDAPYERIEHLNERDYGDYTGLNKWEVQERLGEETFTKIRRGWDHPIPNGETMKMVYERAIPFYRAHIVPKLRDGQNVLVVSHGNTIRSLMKYIEDVDDEGIAELEMPFGQILLYHVRDDGMHHHKEVRQVDIVPPKA